MEFKELIKGRRSCRAFDSSNVTDDQLNDILDAGIWAPSPLNLQPWEFVIVRDAQVKSAVRAVAEEAKQKVADNDGPGWAGKYDMSFLEEAPVLVVVLYDPKRSGLGSFFGQKYGALGAVSACIQNISLAAADMGLGTVCFTWFEPEKLQSVLNIPKELEIAGVLPIGRPKEPAKAPPRKAPKIHHDRFSV